jgi:hypothetical protein
MMAVGNVGEELAGYTDSDLFLTRDAGFTWEEVHKDAVSLTLNLFLSTRSICSSLFRFLRAHSSISGSSATTVPFSSLPMTRTLPIMSSTRPTRV